MGGGQEEEDGGKKRKKGQQGGGKQGLINKGAQVHHPFLFLLLSSRLRFPNLMIALHQASFLA